VATSTGWRRAYSRSGMTTPDDGRLRTMTVVTTGVIYLQIVIGATMRHTDAGLAIPDFPYAFGHLIPPHWDPKIAIHFAHRVGAVIVSLSVIATSAHIWYHHRDRQQLTRAARLMVMLVIAQVTLGALTVPSRRGVWINSGHPVR